MRLFGTIFILSVLGVTDAAAATVTVMGDLDPIDTPGTPNFLSLPKFDPALGTLTSIDISVSGSGDIFGLVENPDPSSVESIGVEGFMLLDVTGFVSAELSGSGVAVFPSMPPLGFEPLGPFGFPVSGGDTVSLSDASSFALLTAGLAGEEHLFAYTIGPAMTDIGAGFASGSLFGGTLEVTYTFDVVGVPEPSSFALLGTGLVAYVWRRRRRVDR